jgi:hypothetical protein
MMYTLIITIDQSYFLNLLYKNKISQIYLILINFYITIIHQMTGKHLIIEALK